MRKQFVKTLQEILYSDTTTTLLLGDISVFGFKNELQNIPKRVYNIGILEQSTISMAAGMSKSGLIPFVHTIAPFMVERALEQLKIDFGYHELNGNFISIGASYDYSGLGCTHHCPGDILALTSIPNMQIVLPGNSNELEFLLKNCYNNNSPTYYRLSEYENSDTYLTFNKAQVIKSGKMATVIAIGNMLEAVKKATANLDVTLLYYNTIVPFDEETLMQNYNKNIIVCEPFYEGSINYFITKSFNNIPISITNIGVPRRFLKNFGTKLEHDVALGLTSDAIHERIKNVYNNR